MKRVLGIHTVYHSPLAIFLPNVHQIHWLGTIIPNPQYLTMPHIFDGHTVDHGVTCLEGLLHDVTDVEAPDEG